MWLSLISTRLICACTSWAMQRSSFLSSSRLSSFALTAAAERQIEDTKGTDEGDTNVDALTPEASAPTTAVDVAEPGLGALRWLSGGEADAVGCCCC